MDGLTPIEGITVVAEKDDVKVEAVTDARGRYEFRELPEGEYKVHPLLAPALRPAEISDMRHAKPGDTARIHRSILCGVRLDFFALHNGVVQRTYRGAEGKPFFVSSPQLCGGSIKNQKFRINMGITAKRARHFLVR